MVAFHLVWVVGLLFMLAVLAGIAVLVVWAVRPKPMAAGTTHPVIGETPLQILDRRFAAGEINADEYKRSRDLLSGGGKG
jgi:putative membrane protein